MKQVTGSLLSNIENILLNGAQLILNKVFKLTGSDAIEDDIFRQLVIARLSQPMSKLATVECLKPHFGEDAQLHLDDFIVVSDSGLMNQSNIALLESGNYKYII
ncbi:MAG: transposase IS4 family [Prolixibacteraceae bacterium]|nr:MAG: transposase IS4 family [Prolixibacteraceae bacterium]